MVLTENYELVKIAENHYIRVYLPAFSMIRESTWATQLYVMNHSLTGIHLSNIEATDFLSFPIGYILSMANRWPHTGEYNC